MTDWGTHGRTDELTCHLILCLPLWLSVGLSVRLTGCLSICLSVYLSVSLSVCLSVCPFLYLSNGLSVCRPIYRSICLSIGLSLYLSNGLSVCLPVCWLVCRSVCLSVCLSAGLSVGLSVFVSVYLSSFRYVDALRGLLTRARSDSARIELAVSNAFLPLASQQSKRASGIVHLDINLEEKVNMVNNNQTIKQTSKQYSLNTTDQ